MNLASFTKKVVFFIESNDYNNLALKRKLSNNRRRQTYAASQFEVFCGNNSIVSLASSCDSSVQQLTSLLLMREVMGSETHSEIVHEQCTIPLQQHSISCVFGPNIDLDIITMFNVTTHVSMQLGLKLNQLIWPAVRGRRHDDMVINTPYNTVYLNTCSKLSFRKALYHRHHNTIAMWGLQHESHEHGMSMVWAWTPWYELCVGELHLTC